MKMTRFSKSLSLILCIVLIAAMALFTTGCNGSEKDTQVSESGTISQESGVLGEGKTEFPFTVTDANGKETSFTIRTDKTTVGDALLDVKLIAGDDGDYGLYVKTVNGMTVDYDKDGKYWAFYVDGEYAATGVDSTEIKEGATYSFKVE